jgi:hypothetical protein
MNQVDHGKNVKVDAYGQFIIRAKPAKKSKKK